MILREKVVGASVRPVCGACDLEFGFTERNQVANFSNHGTAQSGASHHTLLPLPPGSGRCCRLHRIHSSAPAKRRREARKLITNRPTAETLITHHLLVPTRIEPTPAPRTHGSTSSSFRESWTRGHSFSGGTNQPTAWNPSRESLGRPTSRCLKPPQQVSVSWPAGLCAGFSSARMY